MHASARYTQLHAYTTNLRVYTITTTATTITQRSIQTNLNVDVIKLFCCLCVCWTSGSERRRFFGCVVLCLCIYLAPPRCVSVFVFVAYFVIYCRSNKNYEFVTHLIHTYSVCFVEFNRTSCKHWLLVFHSLSLSPAMYECARGAFVIFMLVCFCSLFWCCCTLKYINW